MAGASATPDRTLAGANAVVWRKVYKDAKQLFLGVELPVQPTPTITHIRFVDKDAHLLSGQTTPPVVIRAPEIGKVGTDATGYTIWEDAGTGPCSYYGGIADLTFGGFGSLVASGQCAASPTGTLTYAVAFQAGVPAHVTPDAQPTPQPPFEWPGSGEGTNGEPAEATRAAAKAALENDPAYGPVIARLDCLLGGDSVDPTGLCIKIPACHGETFETCRTRLQDAGFTGTITKHTLTSDDAIMEEQAGHVTATDPAADTQTEYDTDITVYVNPSTMPTMTSVDTIVADQILQKNPDVDPDPESGRPRVAAETIARRCVKAVERSGISGLNPLDCGSLPLFVTGYDAAGPAQNDIQAIARTPKWVLLNRRVSPDRPSGPTNQWYWDQPGCLQAALSNITYRKPQCDEYPFWPTLQGYGGAFNDDITPYISWTKGAENELQGNRLGQFFSTNNPGPTLNWPGCNITPIPDQAAAPFSGLLGRELLPAPVSTARAAFLNVPIGKFGGRIKTIGLCNRPS